MEQLETGRKAEVPSFITWTDEEIEMWERAEAGKKEKERKAIIASNYIKSSGVKERYWNESFDTFRCKTEEDKINLQKAKDFTGKLNTSSVLLMLGNYGTGKTHLGCSIIREVGGKFVTALRLCIEYETGSDFKAEKTKLQVLEEYSSQKMLVIDEVGRGIKEQTEKELLSYLIAERYERMLPTVLITNKTKSEVLEFLGKPIYDRLKETCTTLEFTGESIRLEKRRG